MASVTTAISVLFSIRPKWRIRQADVLVVEEVSYRLLPVIDQKATTMLQPLRKARYWISPRVLMYMLFRIKGNKLTHKMGFKARYIQALCRTTQCRLVITSASFNDWEASLVGSELPLRVVSFQTGMLTENQPNKKHDVLIAWGNYPFNPEGVRQLEPYGSLRLGLLLDGQPQKSTTRKTDILAISILRSNHVDPRDTELKTHVSAMEIILSNMARFADQTRVSTGFAHNAKARADWYSNKKFEGQYDAVLELENNLIAKYYEQKSCDRYFRNPTKSQYSSYSGLLNSRLVVGFGSAMLLEAIGAGCRVLFCHHFAGPGVRLAMKAYEAYIPKEMTLYTDNYDEFEGKVEHLLNLSIDNYDNLVLDFRKNFINQQNNFLDKCQELMGKLVTT